MTTVDRKKSLLQTPQLPWIMLCAGAISALPMWLTPTLPVVDLPQHLHLIDVLRRLHDQSTLYPEYFALREGITPYVGYYYAVHVLAWFSTVPVANKLVLTLYVMLLPISAAHLLRSLRRPRWPALLLMPLAYGDSFAWGFLNYCISLPLVFFALARCVTCLEERQFSTRTWLAFAAAPILVFLFHAQSLAYLAAALPALILLGRAGDFRALRPRLVTLAGLLPIALIGLFWVNSRLHAPTEIETGAPWRAWGPTFSPENLAFKTFDENLRDLSEVLANTFRDRSDRYPLQLCFTVAAASIPLMLLGMRRNTLSLRVIVLLGIALAFFFLTPFDIRGYMYYLNTRYAHLVAMLGFCALPYVARPLRPILVTLACSVSLVLCWNMSQGFRRFRAEAEDLQQVSLACDTKPRVMGLIFDAGSAVVNHPVFLHASAVVAREHGGIANFSFALTPHSPLRYRKDPPPPTFPSEWRPGDMDFASQGSHYDWFVVRGPVPHQLLQQAGIGTVRQAGAFTLLQNRASLSP